MRRAAEQEARLRGLRGGGVRHTASRYWLTDKGYQAVGTLDATVHSCAVLERVRAFHEAWGDKPTDDLDALQLWEQLDRILRGEA